MDTVFPTLLSWLFSLALLSLGASSIALVFTSLSVIGPMTSRFRWKNAEEGISPDLLRRHKTALRIWYISVAGFIFSGMACVYFIKNW